MTVDTDTRVAAAWTWTLAPRLWSLRSNGRRGGGGGGSPDLYHDQTGTYDKLFQPHSTRTHRHRLQMHYDGNAALSIHAIDSI